MNINEITEEIIAPAIVIHKVLGPGLLESAYEQCMCYELSKSGLRLKRQVDFPDVYKDVNFDCRIQD